MWRFIAILICVSAFLYGILRVVIGSAMAIHYLEIMTFDSMGFDEGLPKIEGLIETKGKTAFIPMTELGYLLLMVLWGVLLMLGSVGAFRKRKWGYCLLLLFIVIYFLTFANFKIVNQKIFVPLFCAALLAVLYWINEKRS